MQQRLTVVLAGSRAEFVAWCKTHHIKPSDPAVVYADNHKQVQRLRRGFNVEIIGTFWTARSDTERQLLYYITTDRKRLV